VTARILVVDDVVANVRLLEARLSAEYFEVIPATSGRQALDIAQRGACDIVLLDVMMPGMDGLEVCRRLKANARTAHLPVIMVTALDQSSDRLAGLDAGADDFLVKPIDEIALVTRVKGLVRLKMLTDQLMVRAATSAGIGLEEALDPAKIAGTGGKVLVVDDSAATRDRVRLALSADYRVDEEADPDEALLRAAEGDYDLAVISLDLKKVDALRLCSQLRTLSRTRALPIVLIVNPGEKQRLLRALELGVNDYLVRPIDRHEMLARAKTQVRRRRFDDRLRDHVQATIEMAVIDALTGLHNRRYLERHLEILLREAIERDTPLSVLVIDVDHFKAINDAYGHASGDEVLREFARRIAGTARGIDIACRLGGEEFVIAMPGTESALALRAAERVRENIAEEGFRIPGRADPIPITASIGIASLRSPGDTAERLLARADEALYRAKRSGRNRVAAAAA
jgi:two-component system cell cycle response regulator